VKTHWQDTTTSSQPPAPGVAVPVVAISSEANGKRIITINPTESATSAHAWRPRRLDVFFQETVRFDLGLSVTCDFDGESFSSFGQIPD